MTTGVVGTVKASVTLQAAALLIQGERVKLLGIGRAWYKITARTPQHLAFRRPGHSHKGGYSRAFTEVWQITPGPEGTWRGERILEVPLR